MNAGLYVERNNFSEQIAAETEAQLKKLFGLITPANSRLAYLREMFFLAPDVIRSKQSYSREDIASKLYKNRLVGNLEEGLESASSLIEKGIGRARFINTIPEMGEPKYQLEVSRPLSLLGSGLL